MIPIELLKKDYGTEMALVVLACRVYCNSSPPAELENYIAENNADWKLVCTICRNHSIRPVVYKTLLSIKIPVEIEKLLKQEYFTCTLKNWKLALETERIIGLLAENGVQAWPYKGSAFSRQFYGDIISRESSDIDLIIQPVDLDKVITIMVKDGYQPEDMISYPYLKTKYFQFNKDFNFNKIAGKERAFHIEFHWRITENHFGFPKNANSLLYNNSEAVLLAKAEVNTIIATNHGLSIFIHHSKKDGFTSLKNILDINQINTLSKKSGDWNYIKKNITDFHLKKAWAISHLLSYKILGIQEQENDVDILEKVISRFLNQILSVNIVNTHTLKLKIIVSGFLICDTINDKLKFIFAFIKNRFTPTIADFKIIRLPHSLFFIYNICKPLRSLIMPYDVIKEKRKLFENNR